MELQSAMLILALCLLFQPLVEASKRHPRQDQKPRRTQKSLSTTTTKPDGESNPKPEVQYNSNEIKYDPIEVRYQIHQYPNLLRGEDKKQDGRSSSSNNLPHVTQTLQQQQVNQQQVHMQQPLLHLPAATPQLHPFHQQQIIQMIQRALYATQKNNQPTAMIIIAQPAANSQVQLQPGQNGLFAVQTQPLLNYYQQDGQQAKYQQAQGTPPQQFQQYIPEPNFPNPSPQNYQFIPTSALHYQTDYPAPTQMPTTHMSPVLQTKETYPQQLSFAQQFPSPAQQYSSPSQEYLSPAQAQAYTRHTPEFASPAQAQAYTRQPSEFLSSAQAQAYTKQTPEYLSSAQAQAYTRQPPEYLGSSHQFLYEKDGRGDGQVGVPVKSLPPIITGFENFSPEQQEKIKEQLSAHFGAPLKLLAEQDRGQYQGNSNGGFVPSQMVNDGRSARSSSSSIMSLTKNKAQKM